MVLASNEDRSRLTPPVGRCPERQTPRDLGPRVLHFVLVGLSSPLINEGEADAVPPLVIGT